MTNHSVDATEKVHWSRKTNCLCEFCQIYRLRACLQEALDFATSKQIPKPRTQKRWSDLLAKTLNS